MGLFSTLKDKFFSVQPEHNPESKWIVTASDIIIITIDSKNVSSSILIAELEDILITTNDSEPIGTDLWWILRGNGKVIIVPGGATGEKELLHRLQKLPGFNNEEVIRAMGSSNNVDFLIWKRN